MNHEYCIGEYEMHEDCRTCQVQSACKRKFNKLMKVYKEKLIADLPKTNKAKDYLELQQMEAKRKRLVDSIKKINRIKAELHKEKYNYTKDKYKFFGVKEE